MSDIQRKLASIRIIDAIEPIPDADAIEVAVLGGWRVVIKKGEFKPGDLCVYFEIDSFLPTGEPAWQFLVDKSSRTFEGVVGHRLRTIKLRGQVSQGFILPLQFAIDRFVGSEHDDGAELSEVFFPGADITDILGIKKWEQPLPAELAGQAEGLFPSFIRRTDQERCQNLVPEIFQFDEQRVLIDGLAPEQADQAAIMGGKIIVEDGKVYSVRSAKADPNARYEVTMKLDGSSMTVFARSKFTEPVAVDDGTLENPVESGVCSRNLQLKVNAENAENTFVKLALQSGLLGVLENLATDGAGDFAVQGELMGPGIQGNREGLKDFKFFVFDVQRIDEGGRYLTPAERVEFMKTLYAEGVDPKRVAHVPVIAFQANLKDTLGITNVKELLAFAEGPSITHAVREGLVFKRLDGKFSFKAISNAYLAKEKD